MNRNPLMFAAMIAATQPRWMHDDETRLIVSNKVTVPADSAERMAAAEAKRQRKNARRALRRGMGK